MTSPYSYYTALVIGLLFCMPLQSAQKSMLKHTMHKPKQFALAVGSAIAATYAATSFAAYYVTKSSPASSSSFIPKR